MSPKSHLRVITYCQTRGAECAKGFLFWFGITADESCRKDGGKLKMDVATFTHYLELYGGWAVFIIVLLEYMNLPGFPAGIIMPMAGIWAAKGGISFFMTMVLSVSAGLVGSWILYCVGRFGGAVFLKKYLKRFPKHKEAIDRTFNILREKGFWGVFVSKLIPMVRTLISIPAGVLEMDFWKYTLSSTLGIMIWNFFFVGAGYVFGDRVLSFFIK